MTEPCAGADVGQADDVAGGGLVGKEGAKALYGLFSWGLMGGETWLVDCDGRRSKARYCSFEFALEGRKDVENSETGRSVRERLAVILIGLSSFKSCH